MIMKFHDFALSLMEEYILTLEIGLLMAAAAFFTVLFLLLTWPYIMQQSKHDIGVLKFIGKLLAISSVAALAVFLLYASYKATSSASTSQSAKQETTSSPKKSSKLVKTTQKADTSSKTVDDGEKMNLVLAALGVFVTLVTGISVVVARNAVEDVSRIANEGKENIQHMVNESRQLINQTVNELEQKLQLNETLELQKSLNLLLSSITATNADMTRYANMSEMEGFNRMPLLKQKLSLLTHLSRLARPNFSNEKTLFYLATFRAILESNDHYKFRKTEFFNADDKEALLTTIEFLRAPSPNAMRSDYEQTATALVQFIDVLERL